MMYSLAAGRYLKRQFVACIIHFLDFIKFVSVVKFYSLVVDAMEINIISVTVMVVMDCFPQGLGLEVFLL